MSRWLLKPTREFYFWNSSYKKSSFQTFFEVTTHVSSYTANSSD